MTEKVRITINEWAVATAARPAFQRAASEYEAELAEVGAKHKGGSVDEAKADLSKMHQRRGVQVDESKLAEYATLLVAGTQIEVRVKP